MNGEEAPKQEVDLPIDKVADARLLAYSKLLFRIQKRVVIEKREADARNK